MTTQFWGLRHAMKRLAAILVLGFCCTLFCVPAGAQKNKPAYPESRAQRARQQKTGEGSKKILREAEEGIRQDVQREPEEKSLPEEKTLNE